MNEKEDEKKKDKTLQKGVQCVIVVRSFAGTPKKRKNHTQRKKKFTHKREQHGRQPYKYILRPLVGPLVLQLPSK